MSTVEFDVDIIFRAEIITQVGNAEVFQLLDFREIVESANMDLLYSHSVQRQGRVAVVLGIF